MINQSLKRNGGAHFTQIDKRLILENSSTERKKKKIVEQLFYTTYTLVLQWAVLLTYK